MEQRVFRMEGFGRLLHPRYSTGDALAKAEALCSFSPSFGPVL